LAGRDPEDVCPTPVADPRHHRKTPTKPEPRLRGRHEGLPIPV